MTRGEIFWMTLVTVILVLNGLRERKHNPGLAILMIAIPLCGWIALVLGKP
jgi:hypothetical protein